MARPRKNPIPIFQCRGMAALAGEVGSVMGEIRSWRGKTGSLANPAPAPFQAVHAAFRACYAGCTRACVISTPRIQRWQRLLGSCGLTAPARAIGERLAQCGARCRAVTVAPARALQLPDGLALRCVTEALAHGIAVGGGRNGD